MQLESKMMNILKLFALGALMLCMPMAAFADSATFLNSDGTITGSGGNDLTLTGSTLAGVTNLGAYDCSGIPVCNGTVAFTTGHSLATGSLFGPTATFTGAGSSFMVTGTPPAGTFTFSGTFSSASWTETTTASDNFWTFGGTTMNGVLTEGSGPGATTFSGINGATIDLTTLGGPTVVGGHNTWIDAGGTTTFPSPVPETSTLTLLGSGLLVIALLTRRRSSHKAVDSQRVGV